MTDVREMGPAAARARVAEYRGLDRAAIEAALSVLFAEVDAGLAQTSGLNEVLVLVDADAGRALAITIFDDEASLDAARDVLAPRAAVAVARGADRGRVLRHRPQESEEIGSVIVSEPRTWTTSLC